jgi:hypothetical protein
MPIFSYFFFVGSVLTGLLLWFGNESQLNRAALEPSQLIGIAKFKPEPEPEHARATTVNFAAVRGRPENKPAKTVEIPRKQRAASNSSEPVTRNKFAEFPHGNLSIH